MSAPPNAAASAATNATSPRGAVAELVADTRCQVGESPVWHADERALYWVDIAGRRLWRLAEDGALANWQTPEQIGCFARHRDGGWLLAGQSRLWRAHLPDETPASSDSTSSARVDSALAAPVDSVSSASVACHPLVDVVHPAAPMRFNDGRCDRQGRFWAATMFEDMAQARAVGAWYRYARGQLERTRLDGFISGNGLAFAPDGRTMYVSDSHPSVQRVWAFDYDIDDGVPSGRREFIDMNRFPGRPDGAAVDADGCYWICGNDAGLVHRFAPDGRLDRSVAVPVKKPAMCAFGGARLETLYITSIRPHGIDLSDQPLAGAVFAVRVGVAGLPEPRFDPSA